MVVRALNEDEWAHELRTFERTAYRLELQPVYAVPQENTMLERFLAGDREPPTSDPYLREWYAQVSRLTTRGRRIERVRIHDEPPTPYQQWERWGGKWNVEAGEVIRYMTRARAIEVELLPAAGSLDWWLLDSDRLVTMRFDNEGRRVENQLVTDPRRVAQACAWWDLAVRDSAPD